MVHWSKLSCGLLIGLACALAGNGWSAEPTPAPLPRLETGMHTAPIRRIATDRAGRWAVTASEDKTARVWAVATGELVSVLRPPQDEGNEGKLYAVALSPDGETVAVGGWTGWDWQGQASIYLFERTSGRLLRRIGGLPDASNHLDFSPDGRWLAASLGSKNGLRLFDAARGAETGRDADYGDHSWSVHFSPDGSRLVTTCDDGQVRLYAVEDGRPRPLRAARPTGGQHPYAARFSPDGRRVAVGFDDSTAVRVLDGWTLDEVAWPDTSGVDNGSLSNVAWSADGRHLLAGGLWQVDGKRPLRRWRVADWGWAADLPLSDNTLMDLAPLPGGGLLFATGNPAWGVLDRDGRVLRRQDGTLADLRDQEAVFGLSADSRRVRFGYEQWGRDARVFDLAARALGGDDPGLTPARVAAPGLKIEGWEDTTAPRLDGRPLPLEPYEAAHALAIAADGRHFVLGAEWTLRLYDRAGAEQWNPPRPVPGVAWAVNLSADGRYVVAGYGDGTIRWHRFRDGAEVLALFPHADRRRWIAWTPEGFYAASGPDAEELMGYHLNRGQDQAGEFVSARQLREHYYQPGLISRRLDADGDRLMAEAVAKLGDVRRLLAGQAARVPVIEAVNGQGLGGEGPISISGKEEVAISVRVRDQGGGIGGVNYYVCDPDCQPQSGRMAGVVGDATDSRSFSPPPRERPYRIEVAALNRAGVEGPRRTILARLTGAGGDAALHILAVGIDNYRDLDLALKHAVADARVVANEIAAKAKPLFKRGVSTPVVLRNDEASLDGIEQAFARLKQHMKPQDTLVIFLAGHGEAPIGKGYTFLPWDFARGAAGARGEGLGEARLRKLLEQSPRNTLLLLDTCDAGGAADMLSAAYQRLNGMSQHVVIGASRRGQFAQEGYQGHGVFSAALLRVMRESPRDEFDRELRVTDLRASVPRAVERVLREMGSHSLQKVSGFLGNADFPVVMR